MEQTCLLVDLDKKGLREEWTKGDHSPEVSIPISISDGADAASMIESGSVVMLVVCAGQASPTMLNILELFKSKVGGIGRFQAVICDEPTPQFMAQVYEYNIEHFLSHATWQMELAALTREVSAILNDPNSPELAVINVAKAIAAGDQKEIMRAETQLNEASDYDYLASYQKGRACEATGRFNEAISAFQNSSKLNKMFKPAATGKGENLLITGRIDEAIQIFEKMEKSNPWDVNRKINLASAFMEKGDFTKAKDYIREAAKLFPDHPRVTEAKVQILLAAGKINDAFVLMDKLSEVGPYFAAKLNDMGIKLSQAGKGKAALALYGKAQKIVRSELRYKVSLNSALACHRLQDFGMALKYLNRCEKEFGSSFEKLEKIRTAVKAAFAKQKQTVKAS